VLNHDIVQMLPVGVFESTGDGKLTAANPAAERILRLPPDGWRGRSISDFYPSPSDRQIERKLCEENQVSDLRVEMRRADGSLFWCEVTACLIRDSDGRPDRIVGSIEDVTRYVEAEAKRSEALTSLESIISHTPSVAIEIFDRDGSVTLWNPAAEEIYGYLATEVLGKRIQDVLLEGDEVALFEAEVRRICDAGEAMEPYEWSVRRKDGTMRHVVSTMFALPVGGAMSVCCMDVDVTARRIAEEALKEREERYRLLFERNLAGVYRVDLEGRLFDCNDACARIFGFYSREQLMRHERIEFLGSSERRTSLLQQLVRDGSLANLEIELDRVDGTRVWALQNLTLSHGTRDLIDGTLIDISDRKLTEERMTFQAFHDALTTLPNRLLFHDRLSRALSHARRHTQLLSVMFLDLDRFKLINDTLGHAVGDQLLQMVAARLRGVLREEDTVSRVGGDEFTILLPELDVVDDALRVAHKVLAAITEPLHIDGMEHLITASIGVSFFPNDGDDGEVLVRAADAAMYRAKELGRNNVQLCTASLTQRAIERLSLEYGLRRAVERSEFFIDYQPQWDVEAKRMVGAEALIRWRREDGTVLPPDEFIALAEETRLIHKIGEWVLRKACEDAQSWQTNGLAGVPVAVNLSPRQFQGADLQRLVARAIEDSRLDPSLLQLEITETVAMQDTEASLGHLRGLKELGVSIAIDDFGTGHSALSHLKNFPVDTVKIDGGFVRGLETCAADAAIIRLLIELTNTLGLTVIAEGVETAAQYTFLRNHGCARMQGFYLGRPMPVEALYRAVFAR